MVFPLEQSSKTLEGTSCPCGVGQDVFLSVLTLVQWSCLFFSSPGQAGLLFLFAFRVFFFCVCVLLFFFSSMGLGRHPFHDCQPKGRLWNCQEGRRLGLADPQGTGAPSLPPHPHDHSCTVLRSLAQLLAPDPVPTSCVVGLLRATTQPLLLLTLAVTIWSFMTNRHLEADWVQRGYLWEGSFPSFGFQASFHTGYLVCTQYS